MSAFVAPEDGACGGVDCGAGYADAPEAGSTVEIRYVQAVGCP